MSSPWVGEPCHGAAKKHSCTTMSAMEVDRVSCTIETKSIAIRYIYTLTRWYAPLTKPIPSDVSKTHWLSLGFHKVWYLDMFCYVMDMFLLWAWCSLLYVRHIEMSQASDWPSHTGNHPGAWVAGRMRLNHISTRCAILITHTGSVWVEWI